MRDRLLIRISVLFLLVLSGCRGGLGGLVATRIVVRGRGESLRSQVLGSYERMGGEVYMLAGVRSVDPVTGEVTPAPEMTDSQERALSARRRMEFNRDDVRWFKREQFVGESFDGRLVFLPGPDERLARRDPWLHRLIQEVVREENEDRGILVNRIVTTNPELEGESGAKTVWRIFAEKYRQEAESGMMVQTEDGAWVRKGT